MKTTDRNDQILIDILTGCPNRRADELPENPSLVELARMADKRMYQEKARYYQMNGNDRRKHLAERA